jgi:hypothetical protein
VCSNALSRSLPSLSPSLKYLALSKNQLSGGIQNTGGLQQLTYVDLSFNKFSRRVPGSLFGFHINTLQLQRNFFSGSIELQDVVSISIPNIDLSYNMLSGNIPPLLSSVQNLFLNNNHFILVSNTSVLVRRVPEKKEEPKETEKPKDQALPPISVHPFQSLNANFPHDGRVSCRNCALSIQKSAMHQARGTEIHHQWILPIFHCLNGLLKK